MRGGVFFCPSCNGELILRKSGNTKPGSKRPHFAHRNLTPNCTPETALHYLFKHLLFHKLKEHLANNQPLPISWNCKFCHTKHSGNLLKKIADVKLEYNLGVCQPDLALLNESGNVFAAIEIVVTHKPEPVVLKHYDENDIIPIIISLQSDEDIDCLDHKISNPDIVETCFNPRCSVCRHFLEKTILTIVDGPCWKCGHTMKVAIVEGGMERGGSASGPEDFTEQEIKIARSRGAILKTQYSRTQGRRYIANSCGNCGSFAGDFYLWIQYLRPAQMMELPSEIHHVGYHCEHCASLKYQ